MFCAYLDESSEKQDAVFAVGGFVGDEREWVALQSPWLNALPHGVEYFHATDCFGGREQFRGVDILKRTELLDKLTDLILERTIWLVAGVIDVPAYSEFSPKALDNDFLVNRYAAPFGAPVEYSCQAMNRPNEPFPHDVGDVCDFFIEESKYSPSARRTLDNMRSDSVLWWRKRIGSLTVGSKRGSECVPLLQVGDLGAFLAAKKVANAPDGRIGWSKYYDKLLTGRRIFKIVHVDKQSMEKLHGLHEDLKREEAEGRNPWEDF